MRSLASRDRGVLAYDVALWLSESFGSEGFSRVLEKLSSEAKAMLAKPVPNEWYPVELLREVYDVVDATFTPQYPDALVSLGRFMAEHGLRGFIKFMVSLISVKTVIWRINTIWRYYHEGGSAEVPFLKENGKHNEGILTIREYDAGPAWCKLMGGYIEVLVASTGAKNVKVEKRGCIHKGFKLCSWLVKWE